MRPQDLACAVRGAHTLTPAIKCCLRHMPALALRRYAIPLKTYACAKSPILQKNIPCNCNKLRPFVFAARRARFWLPRQRTPHYFLHRFADRGARCLPVPLINETRHTHWENNTTALVQVENAKKSTCPAKHTNGILARPCHARRQSAPNAHFGGIAYNTLPRCAPSFYETETKSPQGKLPANKQSAQKETPAHCRHAFFGRPRQHAPHYFLRRFADCAE